MENHTAPAAEEKLELTPETSELEALCAAVHPAVERAGEALEKRYYERLAEEALGPKWPNGKPPEETQALLDGVQGSWTASTRPPGPWPSPISRWWGWRTS